MNLKKVQAAKSGFKKTSKRAAESGKGGDTADTAEAEAAGAERTSVAITTI